MTGEVEMARLLGKYSGIFNDPVKQELPRSDVEIFISLEKCKTIKATKAIYEKDMKVINRRLKNLTLAVKEGDSQHVPETRSAERMLINIQGDLKADWEKFEKEVQLELLPEHRCIF